MEFNEVYNCHCSLRLNSGREVTLDQLTQSRTYAGLLEGTPDRKSNDLSLEWLLARARKDPASKGKPYLVEPVRRSFLRVEGDMQYVLDQQSDRPPEFRRIPEWLLPIECIGIFRSHSPARDHTKDASSLTVVWHQDDFGIDSQAVERLRSVDWEQYAVDWEY